LSGILRQLVARFRRRADEPQDGKDWEARAAEYLAAKGLRVAARNVRMRLGEIDIVAVDGDEVVFVEVKKRGSREFGGPEYAIGAKKRRRIIKAAKEIIVREKLSTRPCRFDVVLIYTGGDTPEFEHIENAFGEDTR
jgi:putative endonuclease